MKNILLAILDQKILILLPSEISAWISSLRSIYVMIQNQKVTPDMCICLERVVRKIQKSENDRIGDINVEIWKFIVIWHTKVHTFGNNLLFWLFRAILSYYRPVGPKFENFLKNQKYQTIR